MPDPATTAPDPDRGPYTSAEVKTLKIAQPIELSFTTKQDASHPPSPWSAKSPPSPSAVAKDPYTCTEVKTLKIVGPIELTLTTTINSSHVPPPPQARDSEDGNSLMDALQPLAQMIIARLDEIRRAQRDPQEDPS
jgi:hypothetical protein